MTELVKEVYERELKNKNTENTTVKSYTVTLKSLENRQYDISQFKKNQCDLASYSIITIDDPAKVDDYTIDTHLDCS
jgi:hypothetical protein